MWDFIFLTTGSFQIAIKNISSSFTGVLISAVDWQLEKKKNTFINEKYYVNLINYFLEIEIK